MDAHLSTDGVDEALRIMYGGLPSWGAFTPAPGKSLTLQATDTGGSWLVMLGRFTGTDPDDDTSYDEPDIHTADTDSREQTAAAIGGVLPTSTAGCGTGQASSRSGVRATRMCSIDSSQPSRLALTELWLPHRVGQSQTKLPVRGYRPSNEEAHLRMRKMVESTFVTLDGVISSPVRKMLAGVVPAPAGPRLRIFRTNPRLGRSCRVFIRACHRRRVRITHSRPQRVRLLAIAQIGANDQVLEIGCATGNTLERLRRGGLRPAVGRPSRRHRSRTTHRPLAQHCRVRLRREEPRTGPAG